MDEEELFQALLTTSMETFSGTCGECDGTGETYQEWTELPGDTWWWRPDHVGPCSNCNGSGTYIAGPTDPSVSASVLGSVISSLDFENSIAFSLRLVALAQDYVQQIQADTHKAHPTTLQSVQARMSQRLHGHATTFEPLMDRLLDADAKARRQDDEAPAGALTDEELEALLRTMDREEKPN